MDEKDIASWAANYTRAVSGGRLLLSTVRDGVSVVHSFPLVDGPQAKDEVRAFKEEVARFLLDAAEGRGDRD
ncbi:MAG: hypothetical protein ACPLRW_06765 [Moorellales bacterium]